MAKNSNSTPKWKVHDGASVPDLRREIESAYKNVKELPKVRAKLIREYNLSPLDWFNRGEAMDGKMLIPTVLQKLEARRRNYVLVMDSTSGTTGYRVGVYTANTAGYKAKIPKTARVILERRF